MYHTGNGIVSLGCSLYIIVVVGGVSAFFMRALVHLQERFCYLQQVFSCIQRLWFHYEVTLDSYDMRSSSSQPFRYTQRHLSHYQVLRDCFSTFFSSLHPQRLCACICFGVHPGFFHPSIYIVCTVNSCLLLGTKERRRAVEDRRRQRVPPPPFALTCKYSSCTVYLLLQG